MEHEWIGFIVCFTTYRTDVSSRMIVQYAGLFCQNRVIDLFSYISFDFDDLIPTKRAGRPDVFEFYVDQRFFFSSETVTGFDLVRIKTEYSTDQGNIVIRIIHKLHLTICLLIQEYCK
ncbi:hypothetical protein A9CBEGH2_14190 [Amedibacterium intestinale]|nr:hypothetical protein A9CBEGH2_14190 [Amedibacterium intestinale]